ncbi:glycosyltransferase family 2 protein [Isobaculum melis]|uniref:Glycosyl transferase family 2 n=1 Tax=Isobaculum melis TaxID=142588 RepID=A0A1H9QQ60_9LACT|nr:glycosyltransferase family 2 protein [Isobaculum melis]SER62560.1 Glycosyl transferase family 2 [Isobaculum melis]
MISVCLSAYNGASFIVRQLESILSQLEITDQVIVIDDCSTDDTVSILKQKFGDRIEIYPNEKNMGVIKSFERALSFVKGDYVFLSDQDDVWLADKVEKVMAAFNQGADIVIHDGIVVDGDFQVLNHSWNHENRNKFPQTILKNVLKNAFTGAMMAFRADLIEEFLPIPDSVEMHDQWIALAGMMNQRHIVALDEPLMQYVRHGGNVTGTRKRSISEKINGRIGTIKAIIKYKK